MADVVERPPNLREILRHAGAYPTYLLPYGGTAIAFFAAGFWGWNDVIYLEQQDMAVTCVDTDQDKLWEMAELYPESWAFYAKDAWEFAQEHQDQQWDVVTADPWTNMIDRTIADLPLWCSLAKQLVVIGCFMGMGVDEFAIPDGWDASVLPRNEKVGWLVLERT